MSSRCLGLPRDRVKIISAMRRAREKREGLKAKRRPVIRTVSIFSPVFNVSI